LCRLFGLISDKKADVALEFFGGHRGIHLQSRYNPHGWGFGWYENGKPVVYKEPLPLYRSPIARKIAYRHSLQTNLVISHVRLATEGDIAVTNTHPFSYSKYIFAHNGHVDKIALKKLLDEEYRERILGDTDSEVYFHWLLMHIEETNDTLVGLKRGVREIIEDNIKYRSINFVLSDGNRLYAFRSYREKPENYTLYYLKRNPKDYDFEHLSKETSLIVKLELNKRERVGLVASEKLTSDEDWELMENNSLIEIDSLLSMRIHLL